MATTKTIHIARWDNFGYNGGTLDRGQIVEMVGAIHDEKLIRLGYIEERKEQSPAILECGECGAKFLSEALRTAHGKRRHSRRAHRMEMAGVGMIDPETGQHQSLVDVDGDRDEKRRMEETPLYLDKTEASLKG